MITLSAISADLNALSKYFNSKYAVERSWRHLTGGKAIFSNLKQLPFRDTSIFADFSINWKIYSKYSAASRKIFLSKSSTSVSWKIFVVIDTSKIEPGVTDSGYLRWVRSKGRCLFEILKAYWRKWIFFQVLNSIQSREKTSLNTASAFHRTRLNSSWRPDSCSAVSASPIIGSTFSHCYC